MLQRNILPPFSGLKATRFSGTLTTLRLSEVNPNTTTDVITAANKKTRQRTENKTANAK
jgi:hypothetical protein